MQAEESLWEDHEKGVRNEHAINEEAEVTNGESDEWEDANVEEDSFITAAAAHSTCLMVWYLHRDQFYNSISQQKMKTARSVSLFGQTVAQTIKAWIRCLNRMSNS
jgi:hypothetical protein